MAWCFYIWHSSTTESSSPLSQVVLMLCLLWSMYYMFYSICTLKLLRYFIGLNVLVIMFSIYGLFRLTGGSYTIPGGGNVDAFYSYKKACISLLPIYAFFYFAKKGLLDAGRLRLYSFVFLAITFMAYSAYFTKRFGVEIDADVEFTNNTGYMFLALIPVVLFWRSKPVFFYSFMGIIAVMIIMCMKRGAILSGFFALFIILFNDRPSFKGKRKIISIFLTIALLALIVVYVIHMVENSEYFMYRYNSTLEGEASSREDMYPRYLNFILDRADVLSLLFGVGFDGSLKHLGAYCHNDWLEMSIDHGLLGLGCFIYYWVCFHQNTKMIKSEDCHLPIQVILVITLCNSLYSFSISNMSIFVTCVLGFCLSKSKMFKTVS